MTFTDRLKWRYYYQFVGRLADIFDGLIYVLTLGLFNSSFGFSWAARSAKVMLKKRIEMRKNENKDSGA